MNNNTKGIDFVAFLTNEEKLKLLHNAWKDANRALYYLIISESVERKRQTRENLLNTVVSKTQEEQNQYKLQDAMARQEETVMLLIEIGERIEELDPEDKLLKVFKE